METRTQERAAAGAAAAWTRHRGPVTGVAAIPGSRTVVTSGYDGAVGLFDLEAGRAELLGYHDHLVNRIVVDRAGARAASCSSDYSIFLWDLENRTRERALLGHGDDVEDFVFVDAATGVSASRDRRVIVWDLRTGAVRRVLEGHGKDVLALAVDGGRVYSSGDDMTLRVWDLESGEPLFVWGPFENETDTCALDPRRGRAVLGCDDGCVRIFDTATGEALSVIEAHRSGIKKVDVSPATGDILSAAYDQRILIWDARTLERKASLERRAATWERSLTWTPDGSRILGGSFDGTVLRWSAADGALELEVGRDAAAPGNPCFNDLAVDPPGEVALVSDDGLLRLARLDPGEGRWLEELVPRSGRVLMNAVTRSREHGLVVGGAHDHVLHLWRASGGGAWTETEVPLGEGPINTVRIAGHPGHRGEVFAGCYSSAIVRVSPAGAVLGAVRVHEGAVKSLRLHPREELGVSCGADGLLQSWSFSGEPLQRFLGHAAIINDVDLEPGGETLATGRLLHSVPIGHRSLKSVCFWDAGSVFAGDYWGGLIRVDLGSGSHRRVQVAENGISSLARCGEHLAACSYDGGLYLVAPDLTVAGELRAMRQRLTRVC